MDYRLLIVTYGTVAAPYLVLRVLDQLVDDEGAAFPLAVPVLHHQTYVDDCAFGADDQILVRQTRDQLRELLKKEGFHLRKWANNATALLSDLDPANHRLATHKVLQDDEHLKVLVDKKFLSPIMFWLCNHFSLVSWRHVLTHINPADCASCVSLPIFSRHTLAYLYRFLSRLRHFKNSQTNIATLLPNVHASSQLTLTSLQHEFWIRRAHAVRFVLYKCIPCTRQCADVPIELMGDLPAARVNRTARAFVHTVDHTDLIAVTLLCRIEACLNSYPIAPVSDNFDDYHALTLGHFLVETSLLALAEPGVLNLHENRFSRWQMVQHITESFWRSWSGDYMHTLQQRLKWRVVQQLAKIGQELGRITACHPGDDNLTRVVTVKTGRSEYKRPIAKFCFLPVTINSEESKDSFWVDFR
ncbi:hypothetical protein ALC56_02411 [Trachymyrmex septentrionalis]|uniref:DUF5641 domain-containing protein n=1 Tax=Trachymyrmex septentrionalis TaxID=34720 RepID=A0A195FS21_9HYME|nr:hypothetical protein ALC56_02411 [Trachymyrmex septentrionalis]